MFLLAFAGDLGTKGLVRLSVEHVGYHAYTFVGFMLFLSLVDIKTDISSFTSSTSTIHHAISFIHSHGVGGQDGCRIFIYIYIYVDRCVCYIYIYT